ncbi:MAG: hypothetical protein GXO27_06570 [Chlorobi bacterium]|nr:hypothetical protein [Chlorobiota bacterium]
MEIYLDIDGVRVRITNPDKVLYPEAGYTKRDVIDYYLAVRDPLLAVNKGRPVVFIRYPHGAGSYSFFQKNVPPNHPEWMEVVEMGKYKPVRYLVLNKIADLIWFVQLHALEFHIINIRKPAWDYPDLMVFDIDPPPGTPFPEVRDFTLKAAPVLEELGYKPYFKTSGKAGMHIVCPLRQEHTVDEVFRAAEDAARRIIERFPDRATLEVRKAKRGDKFLIDIFRNRAYQTFSMPLGTRATPRATVSMPVSREELAELGDPSIYHIKSVPEYLKTRPFAWARIFEDATSLHLTLQSKE